MDVLQFVFAASQSKNSILPSALCTQGFNDEDAQNLSYLSNKKDLGESLGVLTAVTSFVMLKKRYFAPIRSQRQWKDFFYMVGVPPVLYVACQYYTHYQRIGPNSLAGNKLSNNIFNVNAMQLTHKFYKMNRKFTPEEIQQMKFNEKLKKRGPKKYHYNHHIHGDEQKHKERHDAWNLGKHYIPLELKQKIEKENELKVKNGEKLRLHSFSLKHKLDRNGKEIYQTSFYSRH